MSDNKMITRENFKEVDEYLEAHYKTIRFKRVALHTHAVRHFDASEGFEAYISVSVFPGAHSRSIIAYMTCRCTEKRDFKKEGIVIDRMIFTLDELKELESKMGDLIQFANRLGLWT